MRRTRALSRILWVGVACGCSLLQTSGEPVAIYDLQVQTDRHNDATMRAGSGPERLELGIAEFAAREPVSGIRMAVRDPDGAYGVVRGARWSLPPPRLLQAVLVERFATSGRFAGVGPVVVVRGACQLGGELGAFHWDVRGQRVDVRVQARMQCGPDRRVVAMQSFVAQAPLQGRGAVAVAAATEQAVNVLADELLEWALGHAASPGTR